MDLEQCPFRIIHGAVTNVYNKILSVISFCPEQLRLSSALLVYIDVKHLQTVRSDIWMYYFKDFCLIVIGVPQITLLQQ